MRIAPASEVRAAISAHVLGASAGTARLGSVTLLPHQQDGVERVRQRLREDGGVLLADDVGLGKTFVALAVAREMRECVVVAPAALREAWLAAAQRAGARITFASLEMLGRRGPPPGEPDLVIVDEAHHFRSAHTRRFAAASTFCRRSRVLLLSATPVHNRIADLRNILSLYLGQRAHAVAEGDLARHIIRRVDGPAANTDLALPVVRAPQWLDAVRDTDCLERLLSLPPPLPPSNGADGGVLLSYTLVRQWASSRAALRAALLRRLARARAMEDSLATGRMPTRAELAAWCFADGAQQLAFPELMVQSERPDADVLLSRVRMHAAAVRELVAWLQESPDPDWARAAVLRDVCRRHPGERVIAFSEYADTVSALYRLLAAWQRVAMLTHGGGRVAGGPLHRKEILGHFGPRAPNTSDKDAIELLITTDVLSEGVNLQAASVLVHLDLAWNPARLEQRVGRLRRIGATRDHVSVYLLAPPAPAERLLHLQERLREKLSVAARTVGVTGAILPGLLVAAPPSASAPTEERIDTLMRAWRRHSTAPRATPLVGAVRSSRNGSLACVRVGDAVALLALEGGVVTTSRPIIESIIASANGDDIPVEQHQVNAARAAIERWLGQQATTNVVDLVSLHVARSRRVLLHRVDDIARRSPRHTQPRLAPLVRAARAAATATLSVGAERVLDELACASMSDEAWLTAVGEFASLHGRATAGAPPEVLALLILRPC